MALEKEITRLSKILVERANISFDEAQCRLRALTLEIVVVERADNPAAHAAVLTAVSVGRRAFLGGVRVIGILEQPLRVTYPLRSTTLAEAVAEMGADNFDGPATYTLIVGEVSSAASPSKIHIWWDGWRAGASNQGAACDDGSNPLSGIAAGALGVGLAFEFARGESLEASTIDLWPVEQGGHAPVFCDVFLPGAIWMIGLGNLGQAFLWALLSLPFTNPGDVEIVLQDRDKVSEENWATSVLVRDEAYGFQKTKVAEQWALAKGFDVRRVDRWLTDTDRITDEEPKLAFSGVDRIKARKDMAHLGFDCIVDAGLGRTAKDFDRYRLSVFDPSRSIGQHFEGMSDPQHRNDVPDIEPYITLAGEVGVCGAAEIAGASVAAAFVSAVAAVSAVARIIAICSGCMIRQTEVVRLSQSTVRPGPYVTVQARGIRHAGKPSIQ